MLIIMSCKISDNASSFLVSPDDAFFFLVFKKHYGQRLMDNFFLKTRSKLITKHTKRHKKLFFSINIFSKDIGGKRLICLSPNKLKGSKTKGKHSLQSLRTGIVVALQKTLGSFFYHHLTIKKMLMFESQRYYSVHAPADLET